MDCHREGTWPAHRPVSSSVARAKRLPGVSPSAQTLGRTQSPMQMQERSVLRSQFNALGDAKRSEASADSVSRVFAAKSAPTQPAVSTLRGQALVGSCKPSVPVVRVARSCRPSAGGQLTAGGSRRSARTPVHAFPRNVVAAGRISGCSAWSRASGAFAAVDTQTSTRSAEANSAP